MLLWLLLAYGAGLVVIGLLTARRVRGASDFFVAGRRFSGGMVFSTLLAANIGAGSTVGASGLGYRYGLSAWWWSGSAAIGCLFLGLAVAPRLYRLAAERGFLTVGDFLEARYDRSVRLLVGSLLWVGTLLILAGQLLAVAWALEVMLGLAKLWGCLVAGMMVVAYFSRGGLVSAVWVNLIELVVLLAGFAVALPYAVAAAGGWGALRDAAGDGQGASYSRFTGMGAPALLGLLVTLVPSFMISPGLVQKTWGARSAAAARGAALGNAAALALFAFIPALLGMSVRALRPSLPNAELALPLLMAEILPAWLGALGLAALFAAELSTADAVLYMLSTSLAQDLYKTFLHPSADDATLLRVGRRASLAAGALGTVLAVVLPSVVGALRAFYGLMTVALFAPLIVGLYSTRPRAGHARAAVIASVVAATSCLLAFSGTPQAEWVPFAAGVAVALAVFGLAYFERST